MILDLRHTSAFTDFFVLCTGQNARQVKAIVDAVEEALKALGQRPVAVEGYGDSEWVLVDYFDFVVHVFTPESREFYALERLWGSANRIEVTDEPVAARAAAPGLILPPPSGPRAALLDAALSCSSRRRAPPATRRSIIRRRAPCVTPAGPASPADAAVVRLLRPGAGLMAPGRGRLFALPARQRRATRAPPDATTAGCAPSSTRGSTTAGDRSHRRCQACCGPGGGRPVRGRPRGAGAAPPARRRERGFNQAEDLAVRLGRPVFARCGGFAPRGRRLS